LRLIRINLETKGLTMKKTSFVIAILASALLAGACGKKKEPAAPTTPAPAGETMGSAAGSGDMGSAAGSGSGGW
jgi:PBP1b-binding outer membrane lipoprotein LpoB